MHVCQSACTGLLQGVPSFVVCLCVCVLACVSVHTCAFKSLYVFPHEASFVFLSFAQVSMPAFAHLYVLACVRAYASA